MNQRDRVVAAGGELAADCLGIHRLAPFELERGGLLAAAQRDIVPLVGERAVHAVEHLLFDDVADGAFHHAPRAAGRKIHRVLGVEERLQVRLNGLVERHEIRAAVPDHGLGHGLERFIRDGDGTGNDEFVAHKCGRSRCGKQFTRPGASTFIAAIPCRPGCRRSSIPSSSTRWT